jgi:F-type H+-transporting ATPase subunit epsilon
VKSFTLRLRDATKSEEIADVRAFIGEDSSGSFGLLANHVRFMTLLSIGIARYRISAGHWKYIAAAGGVLYFNDNTLTVTTYHYLLDDDYMHISQALQQQLLTEAEQLKKCKDNLYHMEEEVLKRLWKIGKTDTV